MKVRVGDEAPLFTAESVNMGTVTLKDFRGSKVLLVFERYFGCPVSQSSRMGLKMSMSSVSSRATAAQASGLPLWRPSSQVHVDILTASSAGVSQSWTIPGKKKSRASGMAFKGRFEWSASS